MFGGWYWMKFSEWNVLLINNKNVLTDVNHDAVRYNIATRNHLGEN